MLLILRDTVIFYNSYGIEENRNQGVHHFQGQHLR
jgi:hypothetical protein